MSSLLLLIATLLATSASPTFEIVETFRQESAYSPGAFNFFARCRTSRCVQAKGWMEWDRNIKRTTIHELKPQKLDAVVVAVIAVVSLSTTLLLQQTKPLRLLLLDQDGRGPDGAGELRLGGL